MDVIIIGAGLAGVISARNLKRAGLSVTLLEARDRAGGRGFTRAFTASTDLLDFGGSWITPWQHRIRELCDDYGIGLRPRHPVVARRWYHGGVLHHAAPQSLAEDSTLQRLKADAARYASHQADDLAHLSFAQYLDVIAAPPEIRELLSAWWTVSGNGDKSLVPATEFLGSLSHGDGTPDGICIPWVSTLEGGVQSLCERIIAAENLPVRLKAVVHTISHGAEGVQVLLTTGEAIEARAVIVATGLNPLGHIVFDPPLEGPHAEGRKLGHNGRAMKVWAKLEGVPVGILATGGGTGIEWMFTERFASDGATLAVGFGVAGPEWQPSLPRDIENAAARFFPEARFLAGDWHDWNTDPHSRGAWVAGILGHAAAHAPHNWTMTGRLAFASSDIASSDAGWFDAAVISGEETATAVAMDLARRN